MYHCRQWNSWRIYASPVAKGFHFDSTYNSVKNQIHFESIFNFSIRYRRKRETKRSCISFDNDCSVPNTQNWIQPCNFSISHPIIRRKLAHLFHPDLESFKDTELQVYNIFLMVFVYTKNSRHSILGIFLILGISLVHKLLVPSPTRGGDEGHMYHQVFET